MKIITTTQFDRPEYTAKMLESLAKCNGIHYYGLVACLDGETPNKEVLKLLQDFRACRAVKIIINERRLGCNLNTMKALYSGFEISSSVLHVEDDVILSKDALKQYESWAASKDKSFSFCLYNKISDVKSYDDSMYNTVYKRPEFIPWGFGIRRHSLITMLECECFTRDEPTEASWDMKVNNMCRGLQLEHAYVFLSRANNIGEIGRAHV